MVENKLNKILKWIRSYRGGEFISLNVFSKKKGIICILTHSCSSECNRVVERKNKTVKEIINSLLISSNVLDSLLAKAILYACNI